jgi:hypothetical protein
VALSEIEPVIDHELVPEVVMLHEPVPVSELLEETVPVMVPERDEVTLTEPELLSVRLKDDEREVEAAALAWARAEETKQRRKTATTASRSILAGWLAGGCETD